MTFFLLKEELGNLQLNQGTTRLQEVKGKGLIWNLVMVEVLQLDKKKTQSPHCHRRHLGVCKLLTGGCFRCGSTDHFIVNCLRESGDNRSMQRSGRGIFVTPPSTRDRGRGRGGPV